MQMLVYENYNKFISATETIQQMKVGATGFWHGEACGQGEAENSWVCRVVQHIWYRAGITTETIHQIKDAIGFLEGWMEGGRGRHTIGVYKTSDVGRGELQQVHLRY